MMDNVFRFKKEATIMILILNKLKLSPKNIN